MVFEILRSLSCKEELNKIIDRLEEMYKVDREILVQDLKILFGKFYSVGLFTDIYDQLKN